MLIGVSDWVKVWGVLVFVVVIGGVIGFCYVLCKDVFCECWYGFLLCVLLVGWLVCFIDIVCFVLILVIFICSGVLLVEVLVIVVEVIVNWIICNEVVKVV